MLNYILLSLGFVALTHGHSDDVEVIFLPRRSSIIQDEVPFAFTAFGKTIELNLRKNHKLLAPLFQVWRHNDGHIVEQVPELGVPAPCNYLHSDSFSTAAINLCEDGIVNGLVLLDNAALEITPLRETKFPNFLNGLPIEDETDRSPREPHVVKRSYLSSIVSNDTRSHDVPNAYINFANKLSITDELFSRPERGQTQTDLTIELAVVFDEAGYKLFSPFFDKDERKIRDMLLAYVNGVQALFYHPSLGARIDIALVRLDIMKKQSNDLHHWNGERSRLLNSFCSWAERHNPSGDDNPHHWDIALYVSGLDFYAEEDGSSVTMGLAPVNGTCYEPWSCVIAELGVTNRFGKPYPSAGFTSVYIAAHEIGHNLGMRHDSVDNSCSKDGFIMSPSRGTRGETIWSVCSRNVALKLHQRKPCLRDEPSIEKNHNLDHSRHSQLPGREWTSKRQCEILLRDKDATVATLSNACQDLRCKTPHRSGYYLAGPALEGTVCADGKECRGGDCLPIPQMQHQSPQNGETMKMGWTEWEEDVCTSGCVKKSKGAKNRRRICKTSSYELRESVCKGLSYDVVLCKDDGLCKKRRNVDDFAETKCRNFSEYLPELERNGGGLQAPHEDGRLWMGCAIFCKRTDIASYYTPRIELNDLGLDPYFPDGTWCHNDNGQDYFCLRHHCLPEHFRFGKDSFGNRDREEDLTMGPQNAGPGDYNVSDELVRYLSLGADGLPLSKSLPPRTGTPADEDAWIDRDYFEIPKNPTTPIKTDISAWDYDNDESESRRFNIL